MSELIIIKTKVGAACDITSSKRIFRSDYVNEGVPFYRGKEIIEKHRGNIEISTELFTQLIKSSLSSVIKIFIKK